MSRYIAYLYKNFIKKTHSMPIVQFEDLGSIDYKKCWDYQEELFDKVVQQKLENRKPSREKHDKILNHLLFVEHPHVYTLGKSGSEQNLLIDYIQLQAREASFYRINRGGDITYHGPGQLVGYPIFNLEEWNIQVREYIHRLEEAIIRMIAHYGLRGRRLESATGVWLQEGEENPRKICAMGVRASRFVTMHGFAFNVNTDLQYFQHINPCGFTDKGVTSLQKELGKEVPLNEVKEICREKMREVFDFRWK